MFYVTSIIMICLMMGIVGFMNSMKHLLSMLICLEFMVVLVFLLIFIRVGWSTQFIVLIFLIFSVCEGVLGLTILVSMTRSFGGDYLSSFSLSI